MRPQHAALASMPASEPEPEHLEDLGWNDMGDGEHPGADIVQLTPMARQPEPATDVPEPVVRRHQQEIAERIAAPVPAATRSRPASASRAAFTLRLDAQRHLKLRLATTIKGMSAQALVTEALDALLAELPELDGLAAQVKRR